MAKLPDSVIPTSAIFAWLTSVGLSSFVATQDKSAQLAFLI